jgi:hypothetical protein
MKKLVIKASLMFVAILMVTGCNDEFLERKPLDRVSNETFWNTENDLKVYNNHLYNMARNDVNVSIMMGHHEGFDSNWCGIWYLDEFSDNIAPREARHVDYQRLRAGKHLVPTSAQWYGWRGWDFLRAINIGLEHYGTAAVTDAVRNKYIAEARLFRGWFYADKVSKFGDVMWVDKELTTESEELFGPRTPRVDVMNKVLEDLNFACDNLPATKTVEGDPGRLNKWAALLVKSRVCLFEGTWRKYHGGADANKWLTEAADAAKKLMDGNVYKLYTSSDMAHAYNASHRMTDLTGNPEVIYWRKYQTGVMVNHVMSYHTGYNGGATKSMVEDYLCTDGLPISLSANYKGDAVYEDIFENRDPRLRQTIMHPADKAYYQYRDPKDPYLYPRIQGTVGGTTSTTGYHIIKVFDNAASNATYNVSTTPAITLRLAEGLLNYAEAKAELGTITQEDLDLTINKLRDRVGMVHLDLNPPMDPRYASDGVSSLIVEIRRERRVELFMEGFRYDDLRRWKQGKKLETKSYGMRWDDAYQAKYNADKKVTIKSSTVNGIPYLDVYAGTDWATPVFDESKHYLWPIPLNSISQNTAIKQNPGW